MLASRSWVLAHGVTLVGAQVRAKISLSQVVAVLIEQWDELDGGVNAEIAEMLSHDQPVSQGEVM